MPWDEIARITVIDVVVGSRGAPPNANSVLRVWDRVCQNKEEQDGRKAGRDPDGLLAVVGHSFCWPQLPAENILWSG